MTLPMLWSAELSGYAFLNYAVHSKITAAWFTARNWIKLTYCQDNAYSDDQVS